MSQAQPDKLTFIHLSDIHFRKDVVGTVHDIDLALRDAIGADILATLGKLKATATGILVTGDIAFGGKAEEYITAKTWLQNISVSVGQDPGEVVFCVPGNHDVDRDVVRKSVTIRDAHGAIRSKSNAELDPALRERLSDSASGETLFSPMHAYNREFAWGFGCVCTPEAPFWEEPLTLNDGSKLHVRGLTSTLMSGYDKEARNDLILGRAQTTFRKQPDVVFLTLCHHPPDWCRDSDLIEDDLDAVKIQLFGHKHRARVTRINNTVRLSAGAVHPDRSHDWKPGYNIFQVWVTGAPNARKIHVEIHAREWQDAPPTRFKAYCNEDDEVWRYEFPLPEWTAPVALPLRETEKHGPVTMVDSPTEPKTSARQVATPTPSLKSLMYRFSLLPYSKQTEIITEAGFVEDEDKDATDVERFLRAFQRASKQGRLAELGQRIETAEKH